MYFLSREWLAEVRLRRRCRKLADQIVRYSKVNTTFETNRKHNYIVNRSGHLMIEACAINYNFQNYIYEPDIETLLTFLEDLQSGVFDTPMKYRSKLINKPLKNQEELLRPVYPEVEK